MSLSRSRLRFTIRGAPDMIGSTKQFIARCKNGKSYPKSKTRFIVPTDAHYYKITEKLKKFKNIILAPTCFGSRRNHHH
jgi:hypothetical protein